MQMCVPGVRLESAINQACCPSGVLRLGKDCRNRVRTAGLSEHGTVAGASFKTAWSAAAFADEVGDEDWIGADGDRTGA